MLILSVLSALLLCDADNLRADQPEMMELTIMFRRLPGLDLEPFPLPDEVDAIGIVLDGPASQGDGPIWCSPWFGDFGGEYFWTDGLYIADGGPVWYTTMFVRYDGHLPVVPSHGFISLRNSLITSVEAYTASQFGGVWYPDPEGGTEMVFVHGFFQVH
jgi:hypothetical protein